MINFYSLSDNLHQILIRDLSIYYSFKMPVAYRNKDQGLRVRKGLIKIDFEIITAGHRYLIMHQKNFDSNLERNFKSAIYNLAADFTKERMKIPKDGESKPIYIGELNNVSKLSNTG